MPRTTTPAGRRRTAEDDGPGRSGEPDPALPADDGGPSLPDGPSQWLRAGGGGPGLAGGGSSRAIRAGHRPGARSAGDGGASRRASAAHAWSSRALLIGVGAASAGLLATVLAITLWPDGDEGTGPVASTSAAPDVPSPSASATTPGSSGPSAAGRPARLRDGTGRCLDIRGRPETGASAVLAVCSGAATQRWTYDSDGLLRSAAGPGLCLDSHADAGVVILGSCAGGGSRRGGDVRYDRTARGELLPRWDRTLALVAAGDRPGADLVVKVRDGSAGQRWRTDTPTANPA
ncbi:hypothetical protein D9753_02865 [Streptomyces dangxiongensis]|uniref:Ricin B lectin domain-containing protein n=1 Tax=Streptomyces dangxiongensis TaxID=1442032 RepID=A0A3G2JLY5_9ACTN|nr:hypothetical protein D9753_02865 [Streptomyces dangxiongensis]